MTPESFAIWKAKFDEEMKVGEKVKSTKPTGKELFEKNGKSILENEDASRIAIDVCWFVLWVVLDKADQESEEEGRNTI